MMTHFTKNVSFGLLLVSSFLMTASPLDVNAQNTVGDTSGPAPLVAEQLLKSVRKSSNKSDREQTFYTVDDDEGVIKIERAVLKFLEQRQIHSRSSGIIQESQIKEGTLVEVGQQLMLIDSARIELEIEKIRIELDTLTKQADSKVEVEYAAKTKRVAEIELERAKESNNSIAGLISESGIDRLKLMIEKSAAELAKANFALEIGKLRSKAKDAELRIHQLDLEYHKIRSPMKGMIVEIMKRPGEWIEVSQPVAKLVRLDVLKTEVKIPADIAARKDLMGCKCFFQPNLKSLKQKKFPAKVVFVNPEVNPVNSTCRVWIEIENKKLELLPGMLGTIEVELAK